MTSASRTLRVGEEIMVMAVAGAQSGAKLPSVSATVTMAITKDENEAVTLEDGVLTAMGAGTAEITAGSVIAGIAGKLTVTITKPIDKIVFTIPDGDDSKAAPKEIVLADGQTYANQITAVAQDEDGVTIDPRGDWSWDGGGVASVKNVTEKKDGKDVPVMKGAVVTITGDSAGDSEVTATVGGENDTSGSIAVIVSGQTRTRRIVASTSSNGNNFVYDRGRTLTDGTVEAGWTTPATGTTAPTSVFDVNLRDLDSNDLLTVWTLNITGATGTAVAGDATNDPAVGVNQGTINDDGTIAVTISTANPDAAVEAGTYETFISLSATGARAENLRFTITVIDAPE
ncbi:MAG: hypothetical protein OXI19_10355 [Gemmatimonadota bacterium]|nr:hypothetical protein [Gemmatimonadota bacterium]